MQPETDYIKGDDGATRAYQNNYMVVESKGVINFIFPYSKTTYTPNPDGKLSCDPKETEKSSDVGESILGDFNGDGTKEVASVKIVKEGYGNPVDGGTPSIYELQFSNNALPNLNLEKITNNPILINEGDLNADGADDISLYGRPLNGMTYDFSTHSYLNKKWTNIIPSFLIDIGQVSGSDKYISLGTKELQERVFKDGDSFFYIYEDRIIENNGKKFNIQLKIKDSKKNTPQYLTITSDSKKILEREFVDDNMLFCIESFDIQDFNQDGYEDILWKSATSCQGDYYASVYLFDKASNTFKDVDFSNGGSYFAPNDEIDSLSPNSKYLLHISKNIYNNNYTIFTIENFKYIHKGTVGYTDPKTNPELNKNNDGLVKVYKSLTGKESDEKLIESFPYYNGFNTKKYLDDNYKKFE